eukprot:168260-Rhodomonas_salina.9
MPEEWERGWQGGVAHRRVLDVCDLMKRLLRVHAIGGSQNLKRETRAEPLCMEAIADAAKSIFSPLIAAIVRAHPSDPWPRSLPPPSSLLQTPSLAVLEGKRCV